MIERISIALYFLWDDIRTTTVRKTWKIWSIRENTFFFGNNTNSTLLLRQLLSYGEPNWKELYDAETAVWTPYGFKQVSRTAASQDRRILEAGYGYGGEYSNVEVAPSA